MRVRINMEVSLKAATPGKLSKKCHPFLSFVVSPYCRAILMDSNIHLCVQFSCPSLHIHTVHFREPVSTRTNVIVASRKMWWKKGGKPSFNQPVKKEPFWRMPYQRQTNNMQMRQARAPENSTPSKHVSIFRNLLQRGHSLCSTVRKHPTHRPMNRDQWHTGN